MARSFAALYHRIWADPEWRALDVDAQHLYTLLISQANMNMAGVLPMQIRKWSKCVNGWDEAIVSDALTKLRTERFVVVDEDTEEVLVRSLIRNDGAYKTPGMLKSILKFAEAVQAPGLRAVLAVELGRLDPLEGKTAAEGMAAIVKTRVVLSPSGPTEPTKEPIPDGIGDGIGDAFVGTHSGWVARNASDGIADTSGSGSGSGSSLSPLENLGGGSTSAPPRCIRHSKLPEGEEPPCRACQRLRETWQAAQSAASKPKPLPPLCGRCDNRFVETNAGLEHCPRCHPSSNVRPIHPLSKEAS